MNFRIWYVHTRAIRLRGYMKKLLMLNVIVGKNNAFEGFLRTFSEINKFFITLVNLREMSISWVLLH